MTTPTPSAARSLPCALGSAGSDPAPLPAEYPQPIFAAFLRSQGVPVSMAAADAFMARHGTLPFIQFVARCRASLPARHKTMTGAIADQAAWQRHVEACADIEFAERNPSCATCGRATCEHTDAAWLGAAA